MGRKERRAKIKKARQKSPGKPKSSISKGGLIALGLASVAFFLFLVSTR